MLNDKYPDVKVTTKECDAADEEAITSVVKQALDEEGKLDVFFANAAVGSIAPFKHTEVDDFQDLMRVNVQRYVILSDARMSLVLITT
jgi:NAD(P)-dependent dehydrogenase (short-subunit alcohol dehydrogenase family)